MSIHQVLKADELGGYPRPQRPYSCWRCGCTIAGNIVHPYWLCLPCVDVVSDQDIAWVNDEANQPGCYSWEMTPLGKPCGGDA